MQCKVWVLTTASSIALLDNNTALQHALLPAIVTALAPATVSVEIIIPVYAS